MKYPIGTQVAYVDMFDPQTTPTTGIIAGHDPCPPIREKRKEPCYVFMTPTGTIFRQESEVRKLQSQLDTVHE